MGHPLQIVVADDDLTTCQFYQQTLAGLGHQVCVAHCGRQLVELGRLLHPDLIITDIKMPDVDGITAAGAIYQERRIPVILVSGYHDDELLEQAGAEHVQAYLIKPVSAAQLEAAVAMAVQSFDRFQAVRKEAADLEQALADRKLIERAKGAVMLRLRIDEPEAYRRMRKRASDGNRKLVELARAILTAEEVFQALDIP